VPASNHPRPSDSVDPRPRARRRLRRRAARADVDAIISSRVFRSVVDAFVVASRASAPSSKLRDASQMIFSSRASASTASASTATLPSRTRRENEGIFVRALAVDEPRPRRAR